MPRRPVAAALPTARVRSALAGAPSWLALALGLVAIAYLALPTLTAPARPIDDDTAQYLALGQDVAQGSAFTFNGTTSEPILIGWRWYPLMFSAIWMVTGVQLGSAVVSVKLAFVALALVGMILGWRLYGPVAGAVGAALFAANPYLGELTLRLEIDIFQTLVLALFLLTLYQAVSSERVSLWIVAGILLGVAFRTRETAAVWVPLLLALPLLVPGWRSSRNITWAGLAYLALLAVAGPKLVEAGIFGRLSPMDWFDPASRVRLLAVLVAAPLACLAAVALLRVIPPRGRLASLIPIGTFAGLLLSCWVVTGLLLPRDGVGHDLSLAEIVAQSRSFWLERLGPTVPFAGLVLVAWLTVGYWAVRGSAANLFMLAAGITYAPIMVSTAIVGWDPRYILPLHLLSYLMIGQLVWLAVTMLIERVPRPLPTVVGWGAPMVVGAALALVIASPAAHAVQRDEQRTFNDLTSQAAQWLERHAQPGDRVMASYKIASWMRFNSGGQLLIEDLPTARIVNSRYLAAEAINGRQWVYVAPAQDDGLLTGYAAIPFDLLEQRLRDDDVSYLVLAGGFGPMSLAIDGAFGQPTYQEVYRDARRGRGDRLEIVIYKVARSDLRGNTSFPLVLSAGTLDQLALELGTGPDSGLDSIQRRGIRLDLRNKGVLDLEPGWDVSNPRSVGGWLARRHDGA